MWKKVIEEKPVKNGPILCFGAINKGTEFESKNRFVTFYDGENFVDKDGEDLIGINNSVEYWFDMNEINNPI